MYCRSCSSYIPAGLALSSCPSCDTDLKENPPRERTATLEKPADASAPQPAPKPRAARKAFPWLAFWGLAAAFGMIGFLEAPAVKSFLAPSPQNSVPVPLPVETSKPQAPADVLTPVEIKEPVQLLLGSHGDQRNAFLEKDSDSDQVLKYLQSRFGAYKRKPGEKIHIWLENATPAKLAYTFFGTSEQKRAFYAAFGEKLGASQAVVLLGLIHPEALKPERQILYENALRDMYARSMVIQPGDKFEIAMLPFFKKPMDWIENKFGVSAMKVHVEQPSFESWFQMLRFAFLEDFSISMLGNGDFEGLLKIEYLAVGALNESVRLRDRYLAEDMAKVINAESGQIHLVLRGMGHSGLAQELERREIKSESVFLRSIEDCTPYDQYVNRMLKSGRTDYDENKMTDDDRRFLTLGLLTRVVETLLMQKQALLNPAQRSALYGAMLKLGPEQLEEWKGIITKALPRGGLAAGLATADWLKLQEPVLEFLPS